MSSQAWEDYGVPLAPYFVLRGRRAGTVEGEGAAESWPQVASLLRDAMATHQADGASAGAATGSSASWRRRASAPTTPACTRRRSEAGD